MVEHAETEVQMVQIPAIEAQASAKCMNCDLRNLWQQSQFTSRLNMVLVRVCFDNLYYFNTFFFLKCVSGVEEAESNIKGGVYKLSSRVFFNS